jgi:hypothetical protein
MQRARRGYQTANARKCRPRRTDALATSVDRWAFATRSRPEYDGPNGRHERPVVDGICDATALSAQTETDVSGAEMPVGAREQVRAPFVP